MPSNLQPEFFCRLDDSDDELFYLTLRVVVHIDAAAIRVVGIYLSRLPHGGAILDLMGSWRSHLPPELEPTRVVGLGLNRLGMETIPHSLKS